MKLGPAPQDRVRSIARIPSGLSKRRKTGHFVNVDLERNLKDRDWMEERIARLRTDKKDIDRYQRLLKAKLDDAELRFFERRLSEEQFWLAMLSDQTVVSGT